MSAITWAVFHLLACELRSIISARGTHPMVQQGSCAAAYQDRLRPNSRRRSVEQ